jgi:succinate-semialdehyde dehydrogenase/glutarate-semialdehyde dehydrogenase
MSDRTTTVTSRAIIHEPLRIGGRRVETAEQIEVSDPATGRVIGTCANATSTHVRAAVDAADEAFRHWRRIAPDQRAEILRDMQRLLTAQSEDLARLITLEAGKPLAEARGEVEYAAQFALWNAEETRRLYGRTTITPRPDGGIWRHIVRQPVGIVGAITPWNYPLVLAARKVFAALAAGCTVVLKPSELAPMSAFRLADAAEQAGLPAGVLNIITANPPTVAGEVLTADHRVRKLSFTGSIGTGRRLMESGARTLTRVGLELGGNNAFLVFPDADLDGAVAAAVVAKLRNGGQTCVCANRFLVHATLLDEFSTRFAEAMRRTVVGPGFEPATQIGPLIERRSLSRIQEAVDAAVAAGASVLCGGKPLDGPGLSGGSYYPATVVRDVSPDSGLVTDEIFGPVAPIMTFHTFEEAIESANATEYGLAGYVFTGSLRTALRASEDLDAGIVVVNRAAPSGVEFPQGGIKQSGIGLEGGPEGVEDFTVPKYVSIDPL